MVLALVLLVVLGALCVAVGVKARWAERRYPPGGEFATIDGCRMHYHIAGDGPAVVLIHGTAGSLEDYGSGIFQELAKDFRVVAIDRPGHGHSRRCGGDIGTPVAQARKVHELLCALGIGPAIIVGHSWSGALALAFALENPTATAGLVLVEGTFYPENIEGTVLWILNLPLGGPLFAWTIMPFIGPSGIRRSLARAFHPDPIPVGYLERAQAMWTRPNQALAIAVDARRRRETIGELSQRYLKLSTPVSFVVATDDIFVAPERQSLRLARQMPGARLHLVEGAGPVS